jgi:hypothetical protein
MFQHAGCEKLRYLTTFLWKYLLENNHLENRERDIGDYSKMVLMEVILEDLAWL